MRWFFVLQCIWSSHSPSPVNLSSSLQPRVSPIWEEGELAISINLEVKVEHRGEVSQSVERRNSLLIKKIFLLLNSTFFIFISSFLLCHKKWKTTTNADNHDQHSNSSSHSNNQQQQQLSNTSATSAPSNNMSVTNKKTDYDSNQQDHSENNGDEVAHVSKRSKHDANTDNKGSDLIEPKNEYDEDDDDDDGNVEDLTMDELEDMEPGPSNAGGSSQGELSWTYIFVIILLIRTIILIRLSLANGRTKPGITGRRSTERRTR